MTWLRERILVSISLTCRRISPQRVAPPNSPACCGKVRAGCRPALTAFLCWALMALVLLLSPAEGGFRILVSENAERGGPSFLESAELYGDMYVFVFLTSDVADKVAKVDFHLDGEWVRTENYAPYDFGGGGSSTADPYNFSELPLGENSLRVVVTDNDGGISEGTAVFSVVEDPIPPFAGEGRVFENATYDFHAGKPITISWDAVENAEYYRMSGFIHETGEKVWYGKVNVTEKTVTPQKSGHYTFRVRACNNVEEHETCSTWSLSTDARVATVNGESKGWWVNAGVAPPGQPQIQ